MICKSNSMTEKKVGRYPLFYIIYSRKASSSMGVFHRTTLELTCSVLFLLFEPSNLSEPEQVVPVP